MNQQGQNVRPLISCKDPVLRNPTEKFDFDKPQIDPIELAQMLTETMIFNNGLGLSANQIGYPYSVFVMKMDPYLVVFNPRIVNYSDDVVMMEEGCLSYKALHMKITRPKDIRVRFQLPNGDVQTQQFEGLTARVYLHEMEHIAGKVFFDGKVSRLVLKNAINKAKQLGHDHSATGLMKFAL